MKILSEIIDIIPSAFRKLVKSLSELIWENEHCTYNKEDIASEIVGACLQNKSVEYTGIAPNGDTIFERLKKSLELEKLRAYVRSNRPSFRGYITIAIDEHGEMFYGNKNTLGVVGTKPKDGTSYAFEYLVVKAIIRNREFVLDIIPVYDNDVAGHTVEILRELVSIYKINLILIDAGFRDIDLLDWITKKNIHFITRMRTSKNLRKKSIKYNRRCRYSSVYENGKYNSLGKELFVYRFRDKKRDYYLLSDMKEKPRRMKDMYRMRWGIETGFREINRIEIKTTTRNSLIRLFFYIVSVLVYNLWIEIRSVSYVKLDILRSCLIKMVVSIMAARGNALRIMGLT